MMRKIASEGEFVDPNDAYEGYCIDLLKALFKFPWDHRIF